MKAVPYTFTVIRYIHDRAAGESLNVGVLVFAPDVSYIGVEVEPRFERLSRTFSGFDGDVYRQTLNRLKEAVAHIRPRVELWCNRSDDLGGAHRSATCLLIQRLPVSHFLQWTG
jgi:hypothetical protein